MPFRSQVGIALLTLLFIASGCNGPCRELANQFCDCEANPQLRAECIQSVDVTEQLREVTPEEQEQCMQFLETCTCAAVERRDNQACGLTRVPGSTP